ncbi:hypothetical protein [Pendulispora albinea]|uniref:SnoaL-like domain-containing protein n=1 Tax=Pendulispora albinea TaxID=2741071 RepID=A0ABZ2M9X7_9BACT
MRRTGTATVGSLLTGVAADVRGLAAVFALNEALMAAGDVAAIEAVLGAWATTNAECETFEMFSMPGEQPTLTEQKPVFETRGAPPEGLTVDARARGPRAPRHPRRARALGCAP